MMKKKYEQPTIEIINFSDEDIIQTSGQLVSFDNFNTFGSSPDDNWFS